MPDFHQPDETERRAAERTHAADEAAPDIDVPPEVDLESLRDERPSSENDPNAPDRPRT